jgi:hypothetical protein
MRRVVRRIYTTFPSARLCEFGRDRSKILVAQPQDEDDHTGRWSDNKITLQKATLEKKNGAGNDDGAILKMEAAMETRINDSRRDGDGREELTVVVRRLWSWKMIRKRRTKMVMNVEEERRSDWREKKVIYARMRQPLALSRIKENRIVAIEVLHNGAPFVLKLIHLWDTGTACVGWKGVGGSE